MSDKVDKVDNPVLSKDSLQRNVAVGMDPSFLQTTYYGADNKRIKHRVHRGALHLPSDVLDKFEGPEKGYELPAVGSVIRPSLDDSKKVVVAQVRYEERLEDVVVDGLPQKRPVSRILITNEFLKRPDAKRIRGGGDEPTQQPGSSAATPMEIDEVATSSAPNASHPSANTATVPAMTAGTNISIPAVVSNVVQPTTQPESGQFQGADMPPKPSTTLESTTLAITQSAASSAPDPGTTGSTTSAPTSTSTVPTMDNVTTVTNKPTSLVSSSSTDATTISKPEGPKPKDPKVVSLSTTPKSQWELRKPTKDELPLETLGSSSKPAWYKSDAASDLEKAILPEWFDQSSKHRTPDSYLQAREKMILMANELGENRFLTGTMVRRAISGDAASLLRLHDFLTSYGLINENAVNDTQPALKLLHMNATTTTRDNIVKAVVQQVRSKQRSDDSSMDRLDINWDSVASIVGEGMTAIACEETFMEMTTTATDDHQVETDSTVIDLMAKCSPSVVKDAVVAALSKTDNWVEARNAAMAACIAQQAKETAETHEARLAQIMGQTLDTRMERLESRLVMIEEVEGMLDAERMALNLERRDLYTARCRSWFNGT